MAQTTRQTNLLVQQDWTKIYQTFTNADFTSYDFETLRNSMINYLKTYYPETFNDFLESSEYLALIDMIAFLGQSLSFRTDLNARESFLDTAQRRDSILKLARMLSYNPQRNTGASGLIKIDSIKTTENLTDSNGIDLTNSTVYWNDLTNDNWLEQFTAIMNAALIGSQAVGKPGNSQTINSVRTEEYSINLDVNTLPIAPFTTNIQGTSVPFEAVSASTVGESFVYEVDPTTVGRFNVLYRNDNNGNGSNNTGFFLYFKQGKLNATEFNITNALPNNYVTIATNNINNNDHWLYNLDVNKNPATRWNSVPALAGINVIYNQLEDKNLYQLNTKINDQLEIVFGDGSFANVPQGSFRFYYRTSSGTTYSITPDDMASVTVAFSYLSKKNRLETLTVTASLKYTVTNANAAPSLSSIKSSAPQQYYTQNRMITAEDYNIFPQTNYSSIQKIKAVNRTSSGVSLYLDALDPNGSFSSTNIFGDDGTLASNAGVRNTQFDFLTDNDIYDAVYNQIIPIINSTETRNYFYGNTTMFPRYTANTATAPGGNIQFISNSVSTTTSSGFLVNRTGNAVLQVGANVSSNLKYIDVGASIKFSAPVGYRFDREHVLQPGNTLTNPGDTLSFFATVTHVVPESDPDYPNLVTFGTRVPTLAVVSDENLSGQRAIIPTYKNDLDSSLITVLINQIKALLNFGLTYDPTSLNSDGTYGVWKNISPSEIQQTDNWLLKFDYNQGIYIISYKMVEYTFASQQNTKFYFDPTVRVYNSTQGININDIIKVLKVNEKPTGSDKLDNDVIWQIYNVITYPDGYVDKNKVLVRSPTTQAEYVPDDPDLFAKVVTPTANLNASSDSLYFQYKHNVPSRSRIDPTPVNIVDVYILTSTYATDYLNYLRDLTGTVREPELPSSISLETAYGDLDNFKAVSDTLIYNPAKFKPLFGINADPSLRARFQVVKNPNVNITDNEIKSRVISAINTYFDVVNWDFGESFYFSELAAYLHSTLAPSISSVIIVPANSEYVFGNYFQINAEPWEIITSAATVNDVEIVSAITAAQLNLGTNLVGTY
jgi:hypothetical protein